jgi:hypothetical protein
MPAVMWSLTWQWKRKAPRRVACMSTADHREREQLDGVASMAVRKHRVAVPVRLVQVDFGAETDEVPAHRFTLEHVETGQIADRRSR